MKRIRDSAPATDQARQNLQIVRLLAFTAVAVALILGAARAWATPGTAVFGPVKARGPAGQEVVLGAPRTATVTRNVAVRVGRRTVRKRVSFKVGTVQRMMACGAAAPCEIVFQTVTVAPGGHTGWHTHPGPTFVAVAQGEGTLYHGVAGCPAHKYGPGSAFFQPTTEVHNLRNEGTETLVVEAFYLFPPGTPNTAIRTDQPQPASCPNIP